MSDTFDRDESQSLPDLINGTTNQKREELRKYLINHEGHTPRNAARLALKQFPNARKAQTNQPPPAANEFEASDIRDAELVKKWLAGEDMTDAPQWIVKEKGIPHAWYAIDVLAPANGIKRIAKAANYSNYDDRWHAVICAGRGHGKLRRTHMGASSWGREDDESLNKKIALAFAARNSIRQLLPMQPNTTEQVAWQETKDQAARKEGAYYAYA